MAATNWIHHERKALILWLPLKSQREYFFITFWEYFCCCFSKLSPRSANYLRVFFLSLTSCRYAPEFHFFTFAGLTGPISSAASCDFWNFLRQHLKLYAIMDRGRFQKDRQNLTFCPHKCMQNFTENYQQPIPCQKSHLVYSWCTRWTMRCVYFFTLLERYTVPYYNICIKLSKEASQRQRPQALHLFKANPNIATWYCLAPGCKH